MRQLPTPTAHGSVSGRSSSANAVPERLAALGVPQPLARQVVLADAFPRHDDTMWPPRAGCCASPGFGDIRMWADINLVHWLNQAQSAFGPHRPGELLHLAGVIDRLRAVGEGARVLIAIDVVPAPRWVAHTTAALAVSELVSFGPALPEQFLDTVDRLLESVGWIPSTDQPNQPCVVNRVHCFQTSWHHNEMVSSNGLSGSCLPAQPG